jgi:membrane-bound lytic murein transglycosylase A
MRLKRLYVFFLPVFLQSALAFSEIRPTYDLLTPKWQEFGADVTPNDAPGTQFIKVSPNDLPSIIPDGDFEEFKTGLKRSISRCERENPNGYWTFVNKRIKRQKWCIDTSKELLKLANESRDFNELWEKAKNRFDWYKAKGKKDDFKAHFTGYFRPVLEGQRHANSVYKHPLYLRPKDLIQKMVNGKLKWLKKNPDGTTSLYWDRYSIDWDHVLDKKDLEIVYINDQIKTFFLHIQGSGIIKLNDPENKRVLVNYAAQNGRKYQSVGAILKKEGADEYYYSSLQGIEAYFKERPEEINRIFPMNPSYVFFKEANSGPYGSWSVLLAKKHSIAIDKTLYPFGLTALISTKKPIVKEGEIEKWVNFSRLSFTHDTGGAIKGRARVDIYWGEDNYAKIAAGNQNHYGELYFAILP